MLFKKFETQEGTMVEPASDRDRLLFSHCSGGRKRVSLEEFYQVIRPLLKAHGVGNCEVVQGKEGRPLSSWYANRTLKSTR